MLNRGARDLAISSFTNQFASVEELNDFSVPMNSYFPPLRVSKALQKILPHALHYYPESNQNISENTAVFNNIANPATVIAGNGATEIISWLNALYIRDSLFVAVPTFGRWLEQSAGLGVKIHTIKYREEQAYRLTREEFVDAVKKSRAKNAVICNPNNPTGSIFSRADLLWILKKLAELDNVIVDESFFDFASLEPPSIKNDASKFRNVWVVRSFGNALGMHGLRIGYAISNENNIAHLRRHMPQWNINGVAESILSLVKTEQEAYQVSRIKTINDTQYLAACLAKTRAFRLSPSGSNFVYAKLVNQFDGVVLRDRLLKNHGILIGNCERLMGASKQHFRIATRPKQQVNQLITAIKKELAAIKTGAGESQVAGRAAVSDIPTLTRKVQIHSSKIPLPRAHIYRKR